MQSWDELGSRVKAARKGQGFTQLELAAAIGIAGDEIARLEEGQRAIDALELSRLAQVLRRPSGGS